MRRDRLDKIDRKILQELQDNGRITNVDLASKVGISAPPCLRRVRALEEAGYIKSYHAHVDKSSLGYGVMIYANVKLDNHGEQKLMEFVAQTEKWPQVRECHMLAGETDFMLKIVAQDWDNYQNFLTEELTATENVASVRSTLVIRTTREWPGVPIEE